MNIEHPSGKNIVKKRITPAPFLMAALVLASSSSLHAFNVITPGDPIIAIDLDFTTGSGTPEAEKVKYAIDDLAGTKYLNYGDSNTGFIVTPSTSSALQSFVLTTANDHDERDPGSWILYGTDDTIITEEHGTGRDEDWTQIGMGDLVLSTDRGVASAPVDLSNILGFSSYKMIFPETRDPESSTMQVAEVDFYDGLGGTGASFLSPANPIIAIRDADPFPSSDSPPSELAEKLIDRNPGSKYLNFGKENSGFIVTPSTGSTVLESFTVTTAGDRDERDPGTWAVYGTNDATILTEENGIGIENSWTEISSGTFDDNQMPTDREVEGTTVSLGNNTVAYTSYRVLFPTLRDGESANSMQLAEISLEAKDLAVLQVNRQSGIASVVADGGVDVDLGEYQIISDDSEALNVANWNSIADGDVTWSETSAEGALLSEEGGNGLSILSGNSHSLGSVWPANLPSIFEDLAFNVRADDGTIIGGAVEYVGTEVPMGDYSGNGTVGPEDWATFIAGYGGNYTGMTAAEAYFNGDLDGDLDSDLADFNLFVAALNATSQSIPEPSALLLALGAIFSSFGFSRSRRVRVVALPMVAVVSVGMLTASSACAQSFTNVGGVPTTSIATGQNNENEDSGPDNFFDDDFLDDTGAIDGELFLLDYNDPNLTGGPYLQYSGEGAAPKTVFFDYGSSVTANWFAYSQRSGSNPKADRVGMFEFWFSNIDFADTVPAGPADATFSLSPTDNRLLDSALRPYTLSGDHSGRYVAMRLTVSELSDISGNTNIGGHEFRLLSGPTDVLLEVDRATGGLTLKNNLGGSIPINMKSYTIESRAGSLDASSFDGVGGDGSFPLGNGTGNGWEIGGASNVDRLAEGYFSGASTLASGETGISLGVGYNIALQAEDVTFTWTNSDGKVYDARVNYVGVAPPALLLGDYNDDGTVDAADYTVWRDNEGTSAILANDPTPGVVNAADYDRWVDNFGAMAALTTSVPEPSTCLLVGVLVSGLGLVARRR